MRDLLSELPPLPLVTLADHNSVMVPGEDSATVTKEVSPVVRSREKEGHVLQHLELDDVWVCVHGEAREEAVKGYTHMAKQRRIDRIHVQPVVLPFVHSAFPVATPSDHKAVVMQLGPPEGPTCPTRFRFPIEALSDEAAMGRLGEGLQKWADRDLGSVEWWAGVTGFLQQEAREWRRAHPTSGYTELHSLVRESTRVQCQANRRRTMHNLVRQLRERQHVARVRDSQGGGAHRGAGHRPGASGLLGGGHGGEFRDRRGVLAVCAISADPPEDPAGAAAAHEAIVVGGGSGSVRATERGLGPR